MGNKKITILADNASLISVYGKCMSYNMTTGADKV